jgi:multidrug efflux pump subunit AcrA (membrane-fusion protein)
MELIMTLRFPQLPWRRIATALAVLLLIVLGATSPRWWPGFSNWVDARLASYHPASEGEEGHAEHAEHADHADAGNMLTLSPSAQSNLGLTPEYLKPIELEPYHRALTVPAVITARPGRTQLHVSTPMTGIITHVHAVTGETIHPGELLFEIRLTHEDLVDKQTRYLETLEELDVELAQLEWLEGATSVELSLEREHQFTRDQLEARELALREALKLHGLSDRQVDWIAQERRLLDKLQVVAPSTDTHSPDEELRLSGEVPSQVSFVDEETGEHNHSPADAPDETPLLIESLNVHKGESVLAGDELCVLADYRELYIEGQAFEHDTAAVLAAAEQGWGFTAVIDGPLGTSKLEDLQLAYVSNLVDPATRVLPFYVRIENEIVVDQTNAENQRFITWRYRPGQRLRMQVPVAEMQDQIVLPAEAVAQDGAEFYVFRRNGRERFDRIAVQLLYRDNQVVVIAQNGAISPGDVVARRGAHEMQMALKNKSGGAIDPHAGHSHG